VHYIIIMRDDDAFTTGYLDRRGAVEIGGETRWVSYITDPFVTDTEYDFRCVVGTGVIQYQ